MNLIEAWNKAKEGQWVRRSVGILTIRKRGAFHNLLHSWEYCEADLLADDWEIARKERTKTFKTVLKPTSTGRSLWFTSLDGEAFPIDQPVEVTLKWEE